MDANALDHVMSRRRFLSRLSIGLSALGGRVVSVPIVAYLLSPLINRAPDVWRDVGVPSTSSRSATPVQVAIEDPSPLPWAGQTANTAAWLRRDRPDQLHRLRGQLHPPRLPGELAAQGAAVPVPVPRRRLLRRRQRGRRAAAAPTVPLRHAGAATATSRC